MFWNYTIYIALIVCIVGVAWAVVHMYRSRNPFVLFGWGVGLIAVGLLAYLFSHVGAPHLLAEQIEMLRNLFIIIAGIGANLLAGAAMAQNAHQSAAAGGLARPIPSTVAPSQIPAHQPEHAEAEQPGDGQSGDGGDDVADDDVHGLGKVAVPQHRTAARPVNLPTPIYVGRCD